MNPVRICVVTSPRPIAGVEPLSDLVSVLAEICGSVYVITGNEGGGVMGRHSHLMAYSVTYRPRRLVIARILWYAVLQVRIAWRLIRYSSSTDMYVFFMAEGMLLPVLTAKFSGRPVIMVLASSPRKRAERTQDPLGKALVLMETLNYRLADRMVVYSARHIRFWGLDEHCHKIAIGRRHFLDFESFRVEKPLNQRDKTVAYIGRLSQEKGVLNFLKAIPMVGEMSDVPTFLIGGDGQLRPEVEECASQSDNTIKYVGWIAHDELPGYLNELKLLVLPSYTEGLPNVMLEAMACGTPVLATPVGGIPDVIKDGETGFIMEDNSPECIAENIVRALAHPDLEQITENARALVEREFTFEKAVERYRDILRSVSA